MGHASNKDFFFFFFNCKITCFYEPAEGELNLYKAVVEGDEEKVKHILQFPSHNEITTLGCANALTLACKAEMLGIAQLLVANKWFPTDPNQQYIPSELDETPFNTAVRSGNKDLVKLILEKSLVPVNLNSVYDWWTTSLILAIENNDATIVKILLEAGADPNVTPEEGYSPLYRALKYNLDIAKMLLEHTSNIDEMLYQTTTRQLDSAFSCILELGMLDLTKFALERGANYNPDDVVFRATFAPDEYEMIELFLQHTYEMVGDNLHELWSKNSFQWALEARARGCLNVLFSWGVYSFSRFADYCPSRTVFHMAAHNENIQAMKMLSELDSQCLQERWMIQGDFPSQLKWSSKGLELVTELKERRKQPSTLVLLCRFIIIDHLGCRPLHKVHKLPLPRQIKNYISSAFTRHIEVGESCGPLQ